MNELIKETLFFLTQSIYYSMIFFAKFSIALATISYLGSILTEKHIIMIVTISIVVYMLKLSFDFIKFFYTSLNIPNNHETRNPSRREATK